MPFMFILAILLFAGAAVSTLIWVATRSNRQQKDWEGAPYLPGWVPTVVFMVGMFFLIMSSLTMVGTKQVGVVTTFNRPTGTMTNGLHVKAPWQKVTDMDGTIQTDSYVGSGNSGKCIDIRIGNGSVACIDATIRWRIVPGEADVLFQDYRNQKDDVNDAIQDSLVKRELTGALNEVYGSYDPLAAVKGGENIEVDALSQGVQEAMITRVKELGKGTAQVEVLSVTTPLIRLDKTTQEKIDAYQQEVANTRIAEQKQATAEAEAKANEAISASISKDPNVLAYKCLNIMEQMAKSGSSVPAGLYCFPGGNAPVVVPGGK
jgi:regulator of protease activity HflC (stomatin/prohibitin superfamily)